MAQLPGVQDLGAAPNVQVYRPASVGGYDVSGYAAGAQALAKGGEQLGAGLERAGQDIADVQAKQSSFEYAQAHSEFLTSKVGLDGATAKATNPGPDESGKSLPNRYAEQLWQQRDAAAAKISDPRMRARFISEVAPTVEHGIVSAQAHATGLQNNADVAYVQQQGETTINKAIGVTDDTTRMQLLDAHSQLVDGLQAKGAITPERAFTMKQEWAHQYATADLLARSDQDPQGVINELRTKPGTSAAITNRILQVEGTDKNGRSSATGAGQFIDSTWLDMIKTNRPDLAKGRSDSEILALRADRGLGRDMTEAYRAQNEAYLKGQGVDSGPGAQYLAHFLGPGAAAAVLKADPKAPIADVLAKAVGPDKAQAMIAANPTILQGQLSGSVKQWADGKMGGQVPGGGSIYDILRPDTREQILAHAQGQLNKQSVVSRAQFMAEQQDAEAEALNTGAPSKPLSQAQFIAEYGVAEGPFRYQEYDAKVQAGAVRANFAQMSPDQRQAAVDALAPKPGEPQYAIKARNHETAQKEALSIDHQLREAPADFAIARSPAAKDAWENLKAAQSGENTAMSPETAARNYVAVTTMEQRRAGAPVPQIVPKGYAENLASQLRNPDAAGGPGAVLARVESESKLWGGAWPQVYREVAPKLDPTLRVVAAGVDPTAGKLLIANHDADEAKILGTQYDVKKADLDRTVTDAMAPIAKTFVSEDTRRDYTSVARKLAAIYIAKGTPESTAATQAVNEIIGSKYDIPEITYRVPHDAGAPTDQVVAGVAAAKAQLTSGMRVDSSFEQAKSDLGLTPQEQALYQRHVTNLTGPGGVDNPNGSRSTLFQMSFERDGKTYNIPTVWDGKILKPDDAIKRADREGIDKFPSYGSEGEAEARYGKMHGYMEKDTARYLQGKLDLATEKDNVGGLRPAYLQAATASALARDGKWVTAPDEKGLMLAYGGDFWPSKSDPTKPFMLTWQQLADMGAKRAGAPPRVGTVADILP